MDNKNIAAVADQLVVEIGLTYRRGEDLLPTIEKLKTFCSQVISHHPTPHSSTQAGTEPPSPSNRLKQQVNDESTPLPVESTAVIEIENLANALLNDPTLINEETICEVQHALMRITLGTWRLTTEEIEAQRGKRGLRWRRS